MRPPPLHNLNVGRMTRVVLGNRKRPADFIAMRSRSSLIEFRHLRCFLAVAESLSFRRAATQLDLSQQQVSQTVSSLESIVEARLFDRTTRNVVLTEAGVTLLARTHELFDHLNRVISDTQLSARGRTGRLILGIAGGTADSLLPQVFSTFREQFPSIYLDIRLQSSGAQLEALARGEIDAGFAISPLPRIRRSRFHFPCWRPKSLPPRPPRCRLVTAMGFVPTASYRDNGALKRTTCLSNWARACATGTWRIRTIQVCPKDPC